MDLKLKDKIAFISGSTAGIGFAIAKRFLSEGCRVVINGRTKESVDQAVNELKASVENAKISGIAADFSKVDEVDKLIKQLPEVDILINNAGSIMRMPAAEHPDEYWDKVLAINLDAPFILAREMGKQMIARGSGKIIFTCSLLSFQGGINVPGYAASKGALASLVKALANEWAGKGVNVNGIAPGYIATDNTEALRNDEERSKSILSRIPANRWGQPEDFKGATIFLASKAGEYVHGTILTVDGGWMGR